jgi:hypothetical protein
MERLTLTDRADQPAGLDLGALGKNWRIALDAAQSALASAGNILPPEALREHSAELAGERKDVARLLEAIARDQHLGAGFAQLALPSPELDRRLAA